MQYFDLSADTVATSPRLSQCIATTARTIANSYAVSQQQDAQSDYTHFQLLNKLPTCSR